MTSADAPAALCLLKLRSNVKLEGDLTLARDEIRSLVNVAPEDISDWKARLGTELAARGISAPEVAFQHTSNRSIQGFAVRMNPGSASRLMRRATFVQEIYILLETKTSDSWCAQLELPQLWRCGRGTNASDDHRLLVALPIYTVLECSDALSRGVASWSELIERISGLVSYLLGDTVAPRVVTIATRAVEASGTNGHLTHGLHVYKAKFFPRLVRSLLNIYSPQDHQPFVVDPFVGSGTVLLEASLLGMTSRGLDIDPLSVMLSNLKVRALSLHPAVVQEAIATTLETLREYESDQLSLFGEVRRHADIPSVEFPHWLRRKFTADEYKMILDEIKAVQLAVALAPEHVRDLFRVAMSDAITRRIKMRFLGTGVGRFALTLSVPTIPRMFASNLAEIPKTLAVAWWLQEKLGFTFAPADAFTGDARSFVGRLVPEGSVDIILTSPPYLPASSGRESYTKARTPSLLALGLASMDELDLMDTSAVGSMNGRAPDRDGIPADALKLVDWLAADELREIKAAPSLNYFADMGRCFDAIRKSLRPGGICLMVVARSHTFYRFSTRERLFDFRNADVLGELAESRGLLVDGIRHVELMKMNRNARPRSLDEYFESVLVLRRPD